MGRGTEPMSTSGPPIISSPANPAFKRLMALQTARGIRAQGACLAGGERLTADLLRRHAGRLAAWVTDPAMPGPSFGTAPLPWIRLSADRFRDVNVFGVPGALLVLRAPELPVFAAEAPWPPGCTLFLPFGDPENVGAAIRAAAGLGAARVVLTREAACPLLPKAVRASAGAVWAIPLLAGPALDGLVACETPLYALDMGGTPLPGGPRPAAYGLVAGQEGLGLPDSLRRRCRRVAIPLAHGIESLNAAAAVAVALWAWRPA